MGAEGRYGGRGQVWGERESGSLPLHLLFFFFSFFFPETWAWLWRRAKLYFVDYIMTELCKA